MSLPEIQPDELWRDPAMFRLQPNRVRLWFAYCALPLLSAAFVLVMPIIDLHLTHSWFTSLSGPRIKGVPAAVLKNIFEAEHTLARMAGIGLGGICSMLPAFHFMLLVAWGLRPVLSRLKSASLRRELRLSRTTGREFLGGIFTPHVRPTLAGCALLLISQWAQMSLIPARYGYFSAGELLFYLLFAVLFLLANVCGFFMTEDFRPFFEAAMLFRHMWQLLCCIGLMAIVLCPLANYLARSTPPAMPGPLLLIQTNGIMLVLIAGCGILSDILWRRMCRNLYDT